MFFSKLREISLIGALESNEMEEEENSQKIKSCRRVVTFLRQDLTTYLTKKTFYLHAEHILLFQISRVNIERTKNFDGKGVFCTHPPCLTYVKTCDHALFLSGRA